MKKAYILNTLIAVCLCACSEEDIVQPDSSSVTEILGIEAVVQGGSTSETRAAYDPKTDPEYVGRPAFEGNDEMIFTKISRTTKPLTEFTYSGIKYKNDNTTSMGWRRQDAEGNTKIYWSDAKSPHTFIGYSVPQQADGVDFDWKEVNIGTTEQPVVWYYGSLGKVSDTGVLDYSENTTDKSLKKDDILLTYNIAMQAEPGGSIAKVHYYHGLANLRIIVNLNGFSTSTDAGSADNKVTVYDMIVKEMPVLYKWTQRDAKTVPLNATEDNVQRIESVYGSGVTFDKKRDIKTWSHKPEGDGDNQNRKFIFHTLTVPTATDAVPDLTFGFIVKYPDPLNPTDPDKYKTAKYKAVVHSVQLLAGMMTTVTINLNHERESMTVGAEYNDWEDVETPDQSTLKKNETSLSHVDRNKITIIGDAKADADDATWLYIDDQKKIRDIYGNDGSAASPFKIATADQLLSFAYEVKGSNRKTETKTDYQNLSGTVCSLTNGFDFTGYTISLDAGLTLQAASTKTKQEMKSTDDGYSSAPNAVRWIGIGESGKPFNGIFLGGGRQISRLYGDHFFHTLGETAVVDKLNFNDVIEVQGCGVIAHVNKGLICSCFLDGDVAETASEGTTHTGSIVGQNNSFIIACAHVGKVTGYGKVGGLVGFNNGTVIASYHSGVVVAKDNSDNQIPENAHPTVGEYGNGTNGKNHSFMFSCYYDKDIFKDSRTLTSGKLGYPFTKATMQSEAFVNSKITYEFDNATGSYSQSEGKTLVAVLDELLADVVEDPIQDIETEEDRIRAMMTKLIAYDRDPTDMTKIKTFKLFEYHFSLNEALEVFRYWLNAIPPEETIVKTNCHEFTQLQIAFLKKHYTAQHIYNYVPAAYPKTQ